MKYLNYLQTANDFELFKNSEDFVLPNVSYIVDTDEVKYSGGDFIIMTSESNPEVMKVCYNQGWAASPYEMYASEAEKVTDIGLAFQYLGQGSSNDYGYSGYDYGYGSSSSSFTFSFDEFKYFTGVTTIEYKAFYSSKIVSIIIPDSVTTIGEWAFRDCSRLESVHIGSGVTSIENSAFQNCTSLTSINIPDSVTYIGVWAFYGCESLPVEDNLRYADTYLVEATNKTLTTYNIKDDTKWIGDEAFYYCENLTSITIPDSVTSIGDRAFSDCSSLNEITCLATTAPSIQNYTFYNVKENGILKVPPGSDYSTFGCLGNYNWTAQYI